MAGLLRSNKRASALHGHYCNNASRLGFELDDGVI